MSGPSSASLTNWPRVVQQFSTVSMDTLVTIQVVTDQDRTAIAPAVQGALAWFDAVEHVCTRFDPNSEVMRLLAHVGRPVKISTLLFEVVRFALQLAELTDGAFDPTIGAALEQLGYATNYRTGEVVRSNVDAHAGTFRDVRLDARSRTLTLARPVVLDLNAVCKGLAIDLAAQSLAEHFSGVCVEAGGDLYARGLNAAGQPWRVGIQHPRAESVLARTVEVTHAAVCTSGDYERGGHVLDARSLAAVRDLASVSVVAPTAMAADGLSTAAMVLGRERGLALLESQGVEGLLLAPDGAAFQTPAFPG